MKQTFTSLPVDPSTPASVQDAITASYDRLSQISSFASGQKIAPFNQPILPDASTSVQRALSDITANLNALSWAKQNGLAFTAAPFSRLSLPDASPSVRSAISDLYDKLALAAH